MRHFILFSLAFTMFAGTACTHHASDSSAPAVHHSEETEGLVNEINEMGTPEANWPAAKLNLYASRLARLEMLTQASKNAVSRAFLVSARAQLKEAQGLTEVAKITQADLDRDLADLNAMGIPKATWTEHQMDAFETQLNQVEVAAKQLGDVKDELRISEIRSELSEERLSAVRQRQADELYQQTLEIARAASAKCEDLAEAANHAADRLAAMQTAAACTGDAVTALGNAMMLADKRGDQDSVQIFTDEIAEIQHYRELVQHAQITNDFDLAVKKTTDTFVTTFRARHPEGAKGSEPKVLAKALADLGVPSLDWADDKVRNYVERLEALEHALTFRPDGEASLLVKRAHADLDNFRRQLVIKHAAVEALGQSLKRIQDLKAECAAVHTARVQAKAGSAEANAWGSSLDNETNCKHKLTLTIESALQNAGSQGDDKVTLALRDEYRRLLTGN